MKPDAVFKLVQELKRRRVFRGIVVYGASTLILLEAAQNISNVFGLDAVPRWFLLLLGVGFLLSLWFSWIYDITPGGIRKTEPSSEAKVPIPKKEVRTYQTTTFISVVIIIVLLSYNIIDNAKAKQIKSLDKSIAVLPLYDAELSPTEARNFEFIGHEITSCLTKVKEYRIVPWEDSRKYSRQGKKYSSMGNDLSAAILVDWRPHETETDRRLSVDLISAADESLLWSENYEIEGKWPAEICKYSREISKKITRKLRTYLTPEEKVMLSEQPFSARATMYASLGTAMTRDSWQNVQTGNYFIDTLKSESFDSTSFELALEYFTEAIKEDPTFAEAYAKRAIARLWGIRAGFFDPAVLNICEADIRSAFKLHPDLPDAHVAMGFYYYYGLSEQNLALTSFEKAVEFRPDNFEYILYLSIIWRTMGNWKIVQTLSDKVMESNSRNALHQINLGLSYQCLHQFSKALACQNKAIELMPKWYVPYIHKATSFLLAGDLSMVRKVLKKAQEETGKVFNRLLAEIDLYDGRYASAIERIEKITTKEISDTRETEGDIFLLKAKIYKYAERLNIAKENYKLAADYFRNQFMFNPEDYYSCSKLGVAYAGLGMNQKAVEHGLKALEKIDPPVDAVTDPYIIYYMIEIYALIGDYQSGRILVQDLLKRKGLFTSTSIKLDPDIRQMLDDPATKLINP